MSQNSRMKETARERKQARHARHVVNGIFIGLIALMIICLLVFYVLAG